MRVQTSNDTFNTSLGNALVRLEYIKQADLDEALQIHQRIGVPLSVVLLSRRYINRHELGEVIGGLLGVPFHDVEKEQPNEDLIRCFDYETLITRRFLPLRWAHDRGVVEVGISGANLDEVVEAVRETLGPRVMVRLLTLTNWDIDKWVRIAFKREMIDESVYGLYRRHPNESAYTVMTKAQFAFFGGALLLLAVGLAFFPIITLIIGVGGINSAFFVGILFKFVTALAGARSELFQQVTDDEIDRLNDEDLPIYTVLVPVYKEANIVGLLMQNLGDLDYPPEKLEILLLLEENDQETIDAARAAKPPQTVTFVIVPDAQPKTKPKACNLGLAFAKGEYLVIYDAEDQPEPDQLKKALVAFHKGQGNLAVVQAALNYFNANENFLTRMFTLEYSYWFDYMLPGLDHWGLPIPLGGTSNHFRTSVLKELGGWDAFNVTEDADLGIRASALGYRVGIINSTTFEEANNEPRNWLRQRSRWIKGYMQTVLVHTRNPARLVRAVGWKNAAGFLMLIAGTPATFLMMPLMILPFLFWLPTQTTLFDPIFPSWVLFISLFNLLLGNALMIYLNMLAVFKRRYYRLIGYALLNPVYWVMHSISSYKALWQLFTKPFFWEKTNHGITKHASTTR
jgi:glycosyltransferase XagB